MFELVNDTVGLGTKSRVVASQLSDDLDNYEILVKLTEEARRDRQRLIDLGDDSVRLKIQRPNPVQPVVPGALKGDFGKGKGGKDKGGKDKGGFGKGGFKGV